MQTRQDPRELARKFFGLVLPVSADDLKSAYRRECKRLHTDVSGQDTREQFIAMQQAYEYLTTVASRELFTSTTSFEKRTVSGVPLSQLGLGIDPKRNAKDCPDCERKGYKVYVPLHFSHCPDCEYGSGLTYTSVENCRPCNGTGKFTLKSKRVVECKACRGKGTYIRRTRFPHVCKTCKGSGIRQATSDTVEYVICATCSGRGELEVMSPVLPKNMFGGFAR